MLAQTAHKFQKGFEDTEMNDSSCLSTWSIDEFLCLFRGIEDIITHERISRIETFIDAYILFDRAYVPERYLKEEELLLLNSDEDVFIPVECSSLIHSDNLASGITIDLAPYLKSFDELSKENKYWSVQHNPELTEQDYYDLKLDLQKYALLRLWQWGMINELAEKTNSTPIFPLSLTGVEKAILPVRIPEEDIILERYREYSSHAEIKISSITKYLSTPFAAILKALPPFFSLLVDQSLDREHGIFLLKQMRRDYKEFRDVRKQFMQELTTARNVKDQIDIINEWNTAWESLSRNQFNVPSFRAQTRKVSSADAVKIPIDPVKGSLQVVLGNLAEYLKDRKSYKQFRIFATLNKELEVIDINGSRLQEVFNVSSIRLS